ncbi:flavodoxin domain-containing protein [Kocuria rosea]|uniref:Flavodoxin n=1 Tax=Kocuria rosea TaxID=1275 RepID=A0A4R5YF48_KOCRO|nr:flavodoxin domain-containing protein [Kocuria rosea]TDL42848.1 flavodoxin [Kocuria rosea]
MRILVAHASAHGSTAEIARRIADVLRKEGSSVDVGPMEQQDGLGDYDAVVLGSAVHDQDWLPVATAFVHRHQAVLRTRPVWLSSVGMSAALPRILRGPARRAQNRRLAASLREVVHPRGHLLLSGVAQAEQLPGWAGLLLRGTGGRFGDHRDWPRIEAWARDIAGALRTTTRGG